MSDTKAINILTKLRKKVSRERTFYRGLERTAVGASKERAFGEANVCSKVIQLIDKELRTLKAES